MITSYGVSLTGMVRKTNEDCIYQDEKPFYILADGMGGYKGGQIASTVAVSAAADYLRSLSSEEMNDAALQEAVERANEAVLEKKKGHEDLALMGTTMVIAVPLKSHLLWCHVGDSRLYLYRKGALRQITKDHSFVMNLLAEGKITVEEMRDHPRKNEITRAVGVFPEVLADTGVFDLEEGDMILLCSDGLSGVIDDDSIEDVLSRGAGHLAEAADELVKRVYEAGAKDNVSAVVAEYHSEDRG